MKPVEWKEDHLVVLDQTRLPSEIRYLNLTDTNEVATAIKTLIVRGAPLIGVVAAYGMAMTALSHEGAGLDERMKQAYVTLQQTRPTAVNLQWALLRMMAKYRYLKDARANNIPEQMLEEAHLIYTEDLATNKAIGNYGAEVLNDRCQILTICNAGALATAGYGTALGVVRSAFEIGKLQKVWACETRPVLQGARLTVLELSNDGIPVLLITDNMAGYVMQKGEIDAVIVGADRIAANGDTANKIGTYTLAILARHHNIPFYVAAPLSTIDLMIHSGMDIPIENRDPDEIRKIGDSLVTLPEVPVFNPAFDVTPGQFITAIITERGIIRPPFTESLARIKNAKGAENGASEHKKRNN